MEKFITTGTVTSVLSALALVAGIYGKTALQVFLSDPSTVQLVLTLVGTTGALAAGFLQGIKSVADKSKD